MMIKLNEPQYRNLGQTDWGQVFASWRADEAGQEQWVRHYTELGYKSWESWRARHVAPLSCSERVWHLYALPYGLETVPTFYGGPHKSWIEKYYGGRRALLFREIVELPALQARIKNEDDKIASLTREFPKKTQLIGLYQDGRIYILEGMHRCCAISLLAAAGEEMRTELTIALADFSGEELPELTARRG